jgi:hypothetical protein
VLTSTTFRAHCAACLSSSWLPAPSLASLRIPLHLLLLHPFGLKMDPLDIVGPAPCACPLDAVALRSRAPGPRPASGAGRGPGQPRKTKPSQTPGRPGRPRKQTETLNRKPALINAGRQLNIRIRNDRRQMELAKPLRSAAAPTKDALDAALMAEVAFWPSRMSGRKVPRGGLGARREHEGT